MSTRPRFPCRRAPGKLSSSGGSDLPHHAGLAQRAFQRLAVPFRGIGGSLVGALQEFEQRLVWLRGRAHGVIRQDELAERLAEERRVAPPRPPPEPCPLRID